MSANRLLARLVPLLCIGVVIACDEGPVGPGGPITELPRDLTPQERALIDASNGFAFDLFGRLAADEADSNVFVSPISASMVLGMALNGADGETRSEIEAALGFSALTLDEINRSYRDLIDLYLGLDPAVDTRIGNSFWYRDGFPVRPEFLAINREFFDAEVAGLDFGDPGALTRINGWVDEKTNGKIEQIVDQIRPEDVMFLINAIYFKGLWSSPFDPDHTRPAAFRRADGTEATVPLMSQDGGFAHVVTDRYQAIDLPYGGGAFAMTVVLPSDGVSPAELAADLDPVAWRAIVEGLAEERVFVSLPRFEIEYEETLNQVLQDLGIRLAFSPAADFSRMVPGGGVWIDYVKQKAVVTVDERGTEAAAATVGAIVVSMPPEFRADRPFLFLIRERLSGAILFIGQLVDPVD